MGRGVLASTTMTRVRTALRAYAFVDASPLVVIGLLDRFVRTEAPDDFITLLYGTLDAATGRLQFVNAGHLPAVLVDADGSSALVDADAGVPLGVPGHGRVESDVVLQPGSLLLLFTDGLVERRDRGIDEGLSELMHAVCRTAAVEPVEARLEAVVAQMTSDHAADDDVTALLIRRGGTP
jgi:serine phosphatase RsbU (regulator of sigma subunit)